MRVLIIDDSQSKRDAVRKVVSRASSGSEIAIAEADSVTTAQSQLTSYFDLVILDLVLPAVPNTAPSSQSGLLLLELIVAGRAGVRAPQHVVGLTQHEDAFISSASSFSSRLLTLLHYDESSLDWEEPLLARVRHIARAASSEAAAGLLAYGHDLVIVTALWKECEAVLRLPWGWKQFCAPQDHTIYYEGAFERGGALRRVVAAHAPRMGSATSAVLTHKMIRHFRPRYVAMTGITAGVRERTSLGDVVVADPCWDWGSGKWSLETDGSTRFAAAPYQFSLDPRVRDPLRALTGDSAFLADLRDRWPGDKPSTAITVHVGPMASGAAVLSDGATAKRVLEQHRQLLAIDMEAYGVYTAAHETDGPRPCAFVLKSVVDFADGDKNDRHQDYAAYVSSGVLRRFAEGSLDMAVA